MRGDGRGASCYCAHSACTEIICGAPHDQCTSSRVWRARGRTQDGRGAAGRLTWCAAAVCRCAAAARAPSQRHVFCWYVAALSSRACACACAMRQSLRRQLPPACAVHAVDNSSRVTARCAVQVCGITVVVIGPMHTNILDEGLDYACTSISKQRQCLGGTAAAPHACARFFVHAASLHPRIAPACTQLWMLALKRIRKLL